MMFPRITAIMPLLDGQIIEPDTLVSVGMQSVPTRILPLTRPLCDGVAPRDNEALTRNILRGLVLAEEGDLFLCIDSDVVLSDKTVVSDMMQAMEDQTLGAIAVNCRSQPVRVVEDVIHTDIGCMLARRYVLERVRFRAAGGCCCVGFCRDICRLKVHNRIRYLQAEPRGRKVR